MPIAIRSDKIDISSEAKTEEFALKFLKKIKPQDIIFLYGEIGVGKTTFVKYLINGLQKENNEIITNVTSPTFNILNEYQIKNIKINHYDLYRLKSANELKELNLFSEKLNTITLIEWPQIIIEKPKPLIELNFEYTKDFQERSVQIKVID
jgi:tRNA threonylcarbamoyl adenosine modification protein YjeE